MEKDKKYNIVLGLMIFFFILFVGVCIAWGLGYIGVNKDNSLVDSDNSSPAQNNIINNTSDIKNEPIAESEKIENKIVNSNNQEDAKTKDKEKSKTNYGVYAGVLENDMREMAITPRGVVILSGQVLQDGMITSKDDSKIKANINNTEYTINLIDKDNVSYEHENSIEDTKMKKIENEGVVISSRTGEKVLPGIYADEDGIREFVFLNSNVFYQGGHELIWGTYKIDGQKITLDYNNESLADETIEIESKEKLVYTMAYDGIKIELSRVH